MLDARVPLANTRSISFALGFLGFMAFCSYKGGALIGVPAIAIYVPYLAATMYRCRLKISAQSVEVGALLYRTRVEMSQIKPEEAVVLPDGAHPRLRWSKSSLRLPGLQLGWFTTSRGKSVFAATGGPKGRVLIPTTGKHDLMVSCEDPEAVLAALRRAGLCPAEAVE
ncbi:hypothetical protein [Stenotrophomonas sp.]|uniref:hypothetical protein n=1 Tax=Stenotrophomonas sp. TaxID=69392 RepID=UPI00289CF5EF|nr:hypothetical protein [Stenotrophomonas sp.]